MGGCWLSLFIRYVYLIFDVVCVSRMVMIQVDVCILYNIIMYGLCSIR